MFRAQQNAYDDIVAKATDENLTSENWEYILDVCDKVSGDESGYRNDILDDDMANGVADLIEMGI
ncbi:ESCRT-0 subunit protein hse1 [Emydomyces testavorans]|uniref:ESCRT-0 subunit protein hse1 n=1 Tax=Emydomyces testavorans TaxID=2070801 RepID=A0AAF0DIH1_9EURO|nr:ESCRT-0 subunit protein hse1 [Emydomyces testavorans]